MKTLSTYRSQMKCHVIPHLGDWRLSELRPEHLEAPYRRLQADGHSAHVVRAVHRVLRSALNEAVRRRRLAINPALVARAPRAEDVEVEPLSVEESRRVIAARRKRTCSSLTNPPPLSTSRCSVKSSKSFATSLSRIGDAVRALLDVG